MAKSIGRVKTCVFISGRGSNLKSLIKNSKNKNFPAKIVSGVTYSFSLINPFSSNLEKSNTFDFTTLDWFLGFPKYDKLLNRKSYSPGQHGQGRRGRLSNYGLQLKEKQKIIPGSILFEVVIPNT